jgi:hypothetical protein
LLVGLVIILVILGLGMWVNASTDVNPSSVQVAGAVISSTEIDLVVASCYIEEEDSGKLLVVELEAKNTGGSQVDLNPYEFKLILVRSDTPTLPATTKSTFMPMHLTSTCEEAAASFCSIPPDSVRFISLHYYGGTLPQGDEWNDHYLSLEYYDPATPIILSKTLNPEG